MAEVSNKKGLKPTWQSQVWVLAIIGAVTYPGLLMLFSKTVQWANSAENGLAKALSYGAATSFILFMLLIPVFAIKSLGTVYQENTPNSHIGRLFLHLIASTPPLYIFTMQTSGVIGVQFLHTTLWIISFTVCLAILCLGHNSFLGANNVNIYRKWMRSVHGCSALLLILGFVALHLSNHSVALISLGLQEELMTLFRHWYRSELVEPALFILLLLMAGTGIPMLVHYLRIKGDTFRNMQTCSGLYLMFFLCAHSWAVLGTRNSGIETDWVFATGPNGLIYGFVALIPYYILSVSMVITHALLGLRIVLLSHGVDIFKANRIFYALMAVGGVFSLTVTTALLGIHLT